MLKHTFIHLPKVGMVTEANFWRQGLVTWEDFFGARRIYGLSAGRQQELQAELQESPKRLDDPGYFARRLPAREHWRLFRQFRGRAAYLDIETTGSHWTGLQVTVVGLFDGATLRQFVHGFNLEDFPDALQGIDLLITFNGAQFDLPVLKAYFPHLIFPAAHIDLRFLLARLGYKGGLKHIEPRFDIYRSPEVAGLNGYDAVLLWNRYQRGDRPALERLLHYNREDVANLETLMEEAFVRCRNLVWPGHNRY
jgi:uncharacterized protein YprB with RNaseH-like and TPR domain